MGLQELRKRLEASSKYDRSWRPPTGVSQLPVSHWQVLDPHTEAQSACHKFLMLPTHSAPEGYGGLQDQCKRLEASSKYDRSCMPPLLTQR